MDKVSHRGFLIAVFIRRTRGIWDVMTTIYVPEGLVHELGDQVIMDIDKSGTNRIDEVRHEAIERAKKAIDNLVAVRTRTPLPAD